MAVAAWAVSTGGGPLPDALEAVNARLQDVRDDVLDTVRAHFDQFRSSFACVNDLRSKVEDVGREVTAAAAKARATSAADTADTETTLTNQIQACEVVVGALRTLAHLHDLFVTFDAKLERGAYLEAADALVTMAALKDTLPGGDDAADSRVITAIRNQYRRQRSRLRSRLSDLFARAIAVEGREVRVVHELPGVFQHLHYDAMTTTGTILECLQKVGLAADRFADLASKLRAHVVAPVLEGGYTTEQLLASTQVTLRCVAVEGEPSVVDAEGEAEPPAADTPAGDGHLDTDAVLAVIDQVASVFEFLTEHVFKAKPELAHLLGHRLWWGAGDHGSAVDVGAFIAAADKPTSGVAHAVVKLLQAALPDNMDELGTFEPVIAAARDLEASLYSTGMLKASGDGGNVLAAFVDSLDAQFAYKKRQTVLCVARRLCSTEYFNSQRVPDDTDPLSGIDRPTAPAPEWQVSDNAVDLVRLAHSTLEEACAVTPSCAAVLYETARDAVDVFRALVPAMFGSSISAVPRLAMLFHNDCLYIAHHLVSMGHAYRSKLPPPLNRTASLADLVPAFRSMAEESFVSQLQRQRQDLLALAPAVSLDDLGRDDVFEVAETAVKAQMYKLDQLSSQWLPVLPRQVYFAAMGRLLGVVLQATMASVKTLPRVTGPVGHQLHYLFSLMFEGEKFFSSTPTTPSAGPAAFVRCWDKAQRLADALGRDDVNNTVVAMLLASDV